ncbi:glycosyltransferase [Pectinatus brassicae]|uniref:Undecaprenyl-phosphate 4-deoxy-4-formamido-L-arabinose transferase n=1 Tax=Pectinatus brassicae TaxID=862415 RepID=A0A840UK68_9FIRM|nr:glycosyltransferase [Pectinatus brassicae]MBB5335098.1 undecaprenyl-phosphate 4-deoxy-4-formamido-L-arabinose transferase [Pectinatus brassicae]
MTPEISIVIPVYNEEESLPQLFTELYPVMEKMQRNYEIILVNDGSRDKSFSLLYDFQKMHNKNVRVIDFNGNFGQHMAIMAAFSNVRGKYIITLDADLQNPPAEIPNLIQQMDDGHDVVGTYRENRHDPIFRKAASKIVNKITNSITGLHISDYGCMLRGYSRRIVDIIAHSDESTTFIPALGQKYAVNPIEIAVKHREREFGESKYSMFRLIRLNFDLMTSFSLSPLQWVTMSGIGISILSFILVAYMVVRRFVIGSEANGLFTLMAIQFFLTGISIMSLGIIGEYIGRIYKQIQKRPRFVIKKIWEENADEEDN